MLAFHSDADLPVVRGLNGVCRLLERARGLAGLGSLLAAVGFRPEGPAGYCAAHSSFASAIGGPGWLAVGDAALACDPLSSQGLLNALYSAVLAADAVGRALGGEAAAPAAYQRGMAPVADAYRAHLDAWYGLERRWADRPFWARRHAGFGTREG